MIDGTQCKDRQLNPQIFEISIDKFYNEFDQHRQLRKEILRKLLFI